MWEAGVQKTAAAAGVPGRGARSGNTAVRVRCEDGRVPTLHQFFALPARERTRPGQVAGNQVEARSIGNMIRELMLMKFSH